MIQFFFENIDTVEIQSTTETWLEKIITSEGKKMGDINYIFCDDEYLLKINQDHLKHDYYTDIITFDYVKGKTISADIFVSLPRILDNTEMFSKDFDREFNRVLAHGILHLCGFKDKTPDEILIMRAKEDFYLAIF